MHAKSTPSSPEQGQVPTAVDEAAKTPKARRNGRATTRQAKARVSPESVVVTEPEVSTDLNGDRPEETVEVLRARVAELEAEVARLTAKRTAASRPRVDHRGPWGDPIPGLGGRHYALMAAHWPAKKMPVLDAIEHLLGELDRLAQAGAITKADRGHLLFGLRKHLARERGETDYLSPRFRQADAQPSTKAGDR